MEHCRGAKELVLAGDAALAVPGDSAGLDTQPAILMGPNFVSPYRVITEQELGGSVKDVVEVAGLDEMFLPE